MKTKNSENNFSETKLSENLAYLLGLFEGDGYEWTGTFGITNRNPQILERASKILSNFGEVRIRKDQIGAYRVCIVGNPLYRNFKEKMKMFKGKLTSNKNFICVYFAGKYDADGSKWKDRIRFKITYGHRKQILFDKNLLLSIGIESKIRDYKDRNANDLEIASYNAFMFYEMIRNSSIKLCPIRTIKLVP